MRTKLIENHLPSCQQSTIAPQFRWYLPNETERIYLDAIGRRSQHRGWRWIVATCNGCGVGKLAIREADIMAKIAEGRA